MECGWCLTQCCTGPGGKFLPSPVGCFFSSETKAHRPTQQKLAMTFCCIFENDTELERMELVLNEF